MPPFRRPCPNGPSWITPSSIDRRRPLKSRDRLGALPSRRLSTRKDIMVGSAFRILYTSRLRPEVSRFPFAKLTVYYHYVLTFFIDFRQTRTHGGCVHWSGRNSSLGWSLLNKILGYVKWRLPARSASMPHTNRIALHADERHCRGRRSLGLQR